MTRRRATTQAGRPRGSPRRASGSASPSTAGRTTNWRRTAPSSRPAPRAPGSPPCATPSGSRAATWANRSRCSRRSARRSSFRRDAPRGSSILEAERASQESPMRIADPQIRLTLVESHGRRCTFLRETCAALGMEDVRIVCARAEDAGHDADLRGSFDLAVARAVAPLAVLLEYALPLLAPGALLAAPKGSRAEEELEAARPAIRALEGEALTPLALPLPPDAPPQRVLLVRRVGELPGRTPAPAGRPLASPPRHARPPAPNRSRLRPALRGIESRSGHFPPADRGDGLLATTISRVCRLAPFRPPRAQRGA